MLISRPGIIPLAITKLLEYIMIMCRIRVKAGLHCNNLIGYRFKDLIVDRKGFILFSILLVFLSLNKIFHKLKNKKF